MISFLNQVSFQLLYVEPFLSFLYLFFIIWAPGLDAISEMGPNEGIIQSQDHFFSFMFERSSDKTNCFICFLDRFRTLLTWLKIIRYCYPQVFFSFYAFKLSTVHRVACLHIVVSYVEQFTFVFIKLICHICAQFDSLSRLFCNSTICSFDRTVFAIFVSSANFEIMHVSHSSISFMYIKN